MTEPVVQVAAPGIPDAKITEYLLNVDHTDGGPKAQYFLARGFTLDDPRPFIEALFQHGEKETLVKTVRTDGATKYVHEGPLQTPDGVNPFIRSVWRVRDGDIWKLLVTAYKI
jgi:hypothetical protein